MQQRSVQSFCNDHAVLHVRDILHQLEKQTDDSKHRKQTAKHSSQTCLYCNVGRLLLVQPLQRTCRQPNRQATGASNLLPAIPNALNPK